VVLQKSRFVFLSDEAMVYLAASLGRSSGCFLSPLFPAGFVLCCVVLCCVVLCCVVLCCVVLCCVVLVARQFACCPKRSGDYLC